MKAIFISFNQGLSDRIQVILDKHSVRGFTKFELTHGRGSFEGEPHYGNHAWPAMNSSVLAIVEPSKVEPVMASLRDLDSKTEKQGLRAFVWEIEQML